MFSPKKYNIDAGNKILGRLASNISVILKECCRRPMPHSANIVSVSNTKHIKLTGKKLHQKMYCRHTGFPGGLKLIGASKLMDTNPASVLMKAVNGMVPKNRLSKRALKLVQTT